MPLSLPHSVTTCCAVLHVRRLCVSLSTYHPLADSLNGLLRRLYRIGSFSYDGRQYSGPGVQKITPIRRRDEFYQVSKNLIDPMIVRASWRLERVRQVQNPQVYSCADISALAAVDPARSL